MLGRKARQRLNEGGKEEAQKTEAGAWGTNSGRRRNSITSSTALP